MRINIRRGVFETNSSSCHSIVMTKCGQISVPYSHHGYYDLKRHRVEYIDSLVFGRHPFEVLASWVDKALYYMADRLTWEKDRNQIDAVIKEVTGAIKKRVPEFDGFDVSGLIGYHGYFKGDVDHQSIGVATQWVNNNGLERFLFDDHVLVIIDGDEYDVFGDLVTTGLIDPENLCDVQNDWDKGKD